MHKIFFYSRLPLILFPVLTAWLVWRWARELFSPLTGILLALVYAVEPTALGHGSLIKNDVAATFGYLLFWYRAWRFWKDPKPANAAWVGLGLLFALLAKMSMLWLIGVAPLVVLLRFATVKPFNYCRVAIALMLVLAIPYAGALAAYQFDTRVLDPPDFEFVDAGFRFPFSGRATCFACCRFRSPPWEGAIALFQSNADTNAVYLMGSRHPGGDPLYFAIALGLKMPVALQMLLLLGATAVASSIWQRKFEATHLFWLFPPILYIGMASFSALQYGIRLILPALPFGLLICGAAVESMTRRPRVVILAGLMAWLTVRSVLAFPHGISFFNHWVGDEKDGLKYLADSNLDWGQDLPDLAEFKRSMGIRKLYLSYFGNDNPFRYFSEGEIELIAPPGRRHWRAANTSIHNPVYTQSAPTC